MKDLLADCADSGNTDMDCAVWGKWHMHIYFAKGTDRRVGSRFYHNNSPSGRPDKMLYRAGLLWSEGPMRNCVSLQEFVNGVMSEENLPAS